jgi:hypothetical protein
MSGGPGWEGARIWDRCWADRQHGVPDLGIPKYVVFHRSVRVVRPSSFSGSMTQRRFD